MKSGLNVKKLSKSFTSGKKKIDILDSLSISIPSGQMVAIIGESGVGKTTLLHILGTIERADEGIVKLNDIELSSLNEKELNVVRNREIGFIFQFFHLLPEFTAVENVAIPLMISGFPREEALEKGSVLLKKVGLENRLEHFPSQLSGGEQQRVAAVRAVIGSPGLLLADEPTGNLDPKTGKSMMELIRELHKFDNRITIIATHSAEIAQYCDKIYILEKGRLKEKQQG